MNLFRRIAKAWYAKAVIGADKRRVEQSNLLVELGSLDLNIVPHWDEKID